MKERDLHSPCTAAGLFVDQTHSLFFDPLQLLGHIGSSQSEMVDTASLLSQELGNGRILAERLEKLDANSAHIKAGHPNLLVGDLFETQEVEPEHVTIEWDHLVQLGDGDGDVVKLLDQW